MLWSPMRGNPGGGAWWAPGGGGGGGGKGDLSTKPGWNLSWGNRPGPKFGGKPRNCKPGSWLWKCGGSMIPGIWLGPDSCIFNRFSFWYMNMSGFGTRCLLSFVNKRPCWSWKETFIENNHLAMFTGTWMCCIKLQAELTLWLHTEQVSTMGSVAGVLVSASLVTCLSSVLSLISSSSVSCCPDPVTLGLPTHF